MFFEKKRLIALGTLILWSMQLISPFWQSTYALNTTYYVDATSGNDANDGSFSTPWQTLAGLSSQIFEEGDQILLKCGETWTDTLVLGSGALGVPGNPIQIGTYGSCSSSSVAMLSSTGASQIEIGTGAAYINISDLVFSGGAGISIAGASNIEVITNTFTAMDTSAVSIVGADATTFSGNSLDLRPTATGVSMNLATNTIADYNTFSGGVVSLSMLNSSNTNLGNNTFYKPTTSAIVAREDTTVSQGTAINNTLQSNILLTWNASYPMIVLNDENDAADALLEADGNTYINVYKTNQTLVQVSGLGAPVQNYNKTNITTYDPSGTTFGYFGYSSHIGNETRILVNTGATSVSLDCPGGICPEYVDQTNTSIVWPKSVSAHSSLIILWNNSSNILRPPVCSLGAAPAGNIANGDPVTLSWTVTNSSGNTLYMPTATGGTTSSGVVNIGSGVFYPPMDDQVNHYSLIATNSIGDRECTADITTQNNPPLPVTFSMNAIEDGSGFTGMLQASDSSGDTIYYKLFPDQYAQPAHGTIVLDELTGEVTYTPNANFCTDDTFEWRAMDQHGRYSDPSIGVIHVACVNDTPVAIDDSLNATGGQLAILPVTDNDADPDSPYVTQAYTVTLISPPTHGTIAASGSIFEYTPDMAYMGSDSFTYTATDQSGSTSNVGTVNISVAPGMNIPPSVSSGSFSGDEDTTISGTFSGSDLNGDPLTYTAITSPSYGSISITGSGFTYTPDANYNGSDSFDFTANDGTYTSSSATISFTINPIPDSPIANDDTVNIEMDTSANIDVLANDTDGDNPYQPQTLTVTGIITPPTSGSASIVSNRIQYIPNTGFLGSDTLTYQISDQDGNISNTATVNISVSTTNQPPVAESGSYTTSEDIPISATLSGSDPDGTPVSFVLSQDVANGTLTLSSTGGFIYTPNTNYNGTDMFQYHVTDGVFDSAVETVNITITPVNDGPVANTDTASTPEDTPIDIDPTLNDTDPEGDTISLNSISQPLHGTTSMSGNVVHYIPTADYCGSDSFQYISQDQWGIQSAGGNVDITVSCVNDAPLTSDASYTMTGNISTSSGHTLVQMLPATDIDGDMLTYTLSSTGANGTLTLSGSIFTYTPDIDFVGNETFSFTAFDGTLTSNTGTITIDVQTNTYNIPPTASPGSFTFDEDTILSDVLSGSDPEGNPLTFILDQNPTNGVVLISSTGAFTYTPNTNYNGTDVFTYYISDGTDISTTETIDLIITSINDAPVANDDTVSALEDTPVIFDPVQNDTDVDGDALMLFDTTSPGNGAITASGNTLTYIPDPQWCGTDNLSYRVADTSAALSNTGNITLSVTCVNDAPVANDDTVSAVEDTPVTITVLANDTDIDGDTLSIVNLTQPSTGGAVQVSGTSILYTPSANFCSASPITFSYQARDPSGATSSSASVTISSVTCVNDAPVAPPRNLSMVGNEVLSAGTMLSGGTLTGYLESDRTLSGYLVGSDVEGDSLTYTQVTAPSHGTLTLDGSGSYMYRPDVGYYGIDTFTYAVSDGLLTSVAGGVTINIANPHPPVSTGGAVGSPGGSAGGSASVGYVTTYTEVKTLGNTSNDLTSQLYLGNPTVKESTLSGEQMSTFSSASTGALMAAYESLVQPIKEVVTQTENDTTSLKKSAITIRQEGQKLLHSIRKSMILSAIEKKQALQASEENLKVLKTPDISQSQKGAIDFVIRLLSRERGIVKKSVQVVQYLLSI